MADAAQPPLSRRRIVVYFPRLSPPAAADQPARRPRRRGLWLYRDAVEAGRRAQPRRRADPHGGDPRQVVDHLPQRNVRPVQGQPPAAARRPRPAIPADPQRDPRFLDPVHRDRGARGRRHHRLLHQGRACRGLVDHDRQQRQGSDAADRTRRRHARHDERPPHRCRLCEGQVRRLPRTSSATSSR